MAGLWDLQGGDIALKMARTLSAGEGESFSDLL